MNKIFSIIVIFLLVSSVGLSQQDLMFTQYMHNELAINPAYAGSQDVLSITGLYRKQWLNIDGAPTTQSLNLHSPLPFRKNIGLGLVINNDKIGVSNDLNMYGAFSYRLKMSEKGKLQLGIQGGITHHKSDFSQLTLKDGGDPTFSTNVVSKLLPNFGAGAYYYTDKWYVGLAIPQLINNRIDGSGNVTVVEKKRHYFATAGFVTELSPTVKLKPAMFYKYVEGAPMELDLSANFIFQDKVWLGAAYRSFDSIDLLLMLQANSQFRIGYAYDFTLTELGGYTSGSHEIMLNYRMSFEHEKVVTPRYF